MLYYKMAKKKLGIGTIDINKKFSCEDEAYLYAKRLKEFIRYICKKKKWLAQAMIICSDMKKEVSKMEYINSGKRGRPRKLLHINDYIANNWYNGCYRTDWHIHILIVSKPSYALRDEIKRYIDRNWININKAYEQIDIDIKKINKKVYKKNCNIKIADYFISWC